jgi:long-chain acyl-CoA synthetase
MEMLREYAKIKGIEHRDTDALLRSEKIVDLMNRQVDKYTRELARYEKVKKIALLADEMTIESGELTPTLKPRRSFIEAKYREVIDRLYVDEASELAAV